MKKWNSSCCNLLFCLLDIVIVCVEQKLKQFDPLEFYGCEGCGGLKGPKLDSGQNVWVLAPKESLKWALGQEA